MTGRSRDHRGAAWLSLMFTALAGGVVVYGWQRLGGDCWSSGFPSAGSTRLLGIAGLVSAAAAMALGWAAGSRTRPSGALMASIVAFVFGAVFARGAIGLLLLAQSFPLCVD